MREVEDDMQMKTGKKIIEEDESDQKQSTDILIEGEQNKQSLIEG